MGSTIHYGTRCTLFRACAEVGVYRVIRVQWVALLQVGLMVGYPLLISLGLSELWLHPFGAATIAHTNRWVVWADWLFSTPTIIPQPVTGVSLPSVAGY